MTDFKARQPVGTPAGGQFAPAAHLEPTVTLGAEGRRAELDGWPVSMPEPELTIEVADDCTVTTVLNVEGRGTLRVFTDNPSTGRCDYELFEGEFDGVDEDTIDDMVAWTSARHLDMESDIREEMNSAAALARGRIAARATGKSVPATDDELNDLMLNAGHVIAEARKTNELATMAMFSREILRRHPEAASVELENAGYEENDYLSEAHIRDAEGSVIASYGEDFDEDKEAVTDLLRSLNPNCEDAFWSEYTLRAEGFNSDTFEEDGRTLNLKRAADWAPSS